MDILNDGNCPTPPCSSRCAHSGSVSGACPLDRSATIPSLRRSDWGDYLSEFKWSHAVDLTTRLEMNERALSHQFVTRFVRNLARFTQGCVPYFYVVEQNVAGFPHVHALIAGTTALRIRDVQRRWKFGYSRVRLYSPGRGAPYYISKTLLEQPDAWDLSGRMPPRL